MPVQVRLVPGLRLALHDEVTNEESSRAGWPRSRSYPSMVGIGVGRAAGISG